MKKLWVVLLAVLYLGLSLGLVVNWHYCMGQLASIDWGVLQDEHCGKCGMKDQKGCCETASQILKVSDAHLLGKTQLSQPFLSAHEVPLSAGAAIEPTSFVWLSSQAVAHPPEPVGQKRYLLHRVFRI